ncbi:cation:proton antiporter [Streptomyces sp. NPDC007369]|uniref:cation:proton antiporter n=1 Tax=Streptomyces sp. NPDC007369 TaxID=3154589 RepID=UPI0033F2606D
MTFSDAVYLAMGIGALAAAVVPRLVFERPLSLPMVFLASGALTALLPLPVSRVDPVRDGLWVEHATELCVIVSLMGAGLALNRPFGLRRWAGPWRLLGISLPLTIAGTAALGVALGWTLASALLLAAVLAPTDPVLAAEVRVGKPADAESDDDEVRFSLTAEAGLNDGLAFPFVLAALALAGASGTNGVTGWIGRWLLVDVLARIAIGVVIGIVIGRLLGLMFFRARASALRLSEHMEGFVALAATFLAYGAAELLHGYGFLAVFVSACTIRAAERSHGYHKVLHEFTEQIERLLTVFLLFLLGRYLVEYGLHSLSRQGALLALGLVVAVRPAAGWIGQLRLSTSRRERLVTAVFGIRGIGSLYYLAYALGHSEHFNGQADELWAAVAFTILVSVLVHGTAATPAIRHLDRLRHSPHPPP